jgi:hypothetical protein
MKAGSLPERLVFQGCNRRGNCPVRYEWDGGEGRVLQMKRELEVLLWLPLLLPLPLSLLLSLSLPLQ